MRYLTADYVLPIAHDPIKEGVVVVNDEGEILEIGDRVVFQSVDLEFFDGVLLPGFINTHCHLELSHMKGLCPTGTKLIPFISSVLKLREFDHEIIQEHIAKEDANMWQSGIQAVGDISNKVDTAVQKENSPISYYTFVEIFDMMQPALTKGTIENYRTVFKEQARGEGNKKSFVPHAPYSVTPELFDFINRANPDKATISIHNTETADENQMFQNGTGGFEAFYKSVGLSLDDFKPTGTNSIVYALNNLKPKKRNLLVHNTLTTAEDIELAHNWSDQVYWATCPNANLYIENRLPNYQYFIDAQAKVTIGTDSIMSNWHLCIWNEVKTIKKYQSYVPVIELLKWATLNGAEALGYQKTMGSLEVGKRPGIININFDWKGNETDLNYSKPQRII